jgi:hypothetical protein
MSLLDTIDKSEEILLARILNELSEHELLREEQFAFGPNHSMPLQLACLVESDKGLGEKWLTGAVFLYVAQAFHTLDRRSPFQSNDSKFTVVPGKKQPVLCRAGHSKRPSRQLRHLVMACRLG